MTISVIAFIFCLGFSAIFGCFFAWTYHYRKLHKEPRGIPQRVTETMTIPIDISRDGEQETMALRRIEQEKTSFEIDSSYKDAFIKKLMSLFHERLEKENRGILALCYWAFDGEGFALRLYNSPYHINEHLFVPKDNRYFSKKEFNWNGIDEAPLDIFKSSEQISRSIAGSLVSGDGKIRGYITVNSANEYAFNDSAMELRELANLAEETFRILDLNLKFDRENNLLNSMLKDIAYIFRAVSKGNLIANLSKILQDNFRFDRLMIITPDRKDKEKDKWYIAEAVGQQKESFKGVAFNVHQKCLLYDILSGKATVINETKISVDPYQRRLYENEPENLELRSLFAVMPTPYNNSFPIAIVLESKKNKAVSRIESQILTCLVSCAAVKLSDIWEKKASLQKREDELVAIDSNGLGELLNHYEKEIADIRNSEECLGVLFLKCKAPTEHKALNYEKFLAVLKSLKKSWNGRHLAMLGNGEFVFSIRGNFTEEVFKMTARQIIANAKNLLAEENLAVGNYEIWLNKEEIAKKEIAMGHDIATLFKLTILSKFMEMAEG